MEDVIDIYNALCSPFIFGDEVSVRVGPTNVKSKKADAPLKGQPLFYIDARTVMDRLDSVCGFDGWQCTYSPGTPGAAVSIVCNIGLRLAGDWIWKADGAGATDMEAEKGTMSDAFKRAAVRWGVGRYLYDLKAPWFELEQRGQSGVIRPGDMPNLAKLHDDFAQRSGWGVGEGIPAYRLLLADVKMLAPASVKTFAEEHRALIEKFPPAMRRHFLAQIEAIRAQG